MHAATWNMQHLFPLIYKEACMECCDSVVSLCCHLGRARCEEGLSASHGQCAYVGWMEPINVLFKADPIQDALLIDVFGQGKLHQDAMHILVCIVVFHNL